MNKIEKVISEDELTDIYFGVLKIIERSQLYKARRICTCAAGGEAHRLTKRIMIYFQRKVLKGNK